MKKGFTVLELLVVILVIGLLMAVLTTAVVGGTAAARSAKCLANLRNLSAAAVSAAMASGGHDYPLAGSVEWYEVVYTGSDFIRKYYETQGWIGWNSGKAYKGNDGSVRESLVEKGFPKWYRSAYDYERETKANADLTCLRRGSMWRAVNHNREVYICPEHKKAVREKLRSKLPPNWSYVMNSKFGWQARKSKGGYHGGPPNLDYGNIARPDKFLMFAELNWTKLPGCDEPKFSNEPGIDCDCVLQYGEGERIGFNHKVGRDWAAHVVFSDTHVEVIRFPKTKTAEGDLRNLTKYLCEGSDWVIENGKFKKL